MLGISCYIMLGVGLGLGIVSNSDIFCPFDSPFPMTNYFIGIVPPALI